MEREKPTNSTTTTVSPRINFARALSTGAPVSGKVGEEEVPVAGTVEVEFDYVRPRKVHLGKTRDIDVSRGLNKIHFDLSTKHVPRSATASILGVEFSKPGEPDHAYAPDKIFEHPSTFTDHDGKEHTVYGKWKENGHWLKLMDDNWPEGEQLYGYRVWVVVKHGMEMNYYCTEDPKITNEPTG